MRQSERQEHHEEEPWQVPKRSGERVAFNDDIFRKANEKIRGRAEAVLDAEDQLPVICECAEETCSEVLRVPLQESEKQPRVRTDAFVLALESTSL
jgi:hypothetical protein